MVSDRSFQETVPAAQGRTIWQQERPGQEKKPIYTSLVKN
jgi:hypothetical protein